MHRAHCTFVQLNDEIPMIIDMQRKHFVEVWKQIIFDMIARRVFQNKNNLYIQSFFVGCNQPSHKTSEDRRVLDIFAVFFEKANDNVFFCFGIKTNMLNVRRFLKSFGEFLKTKKLLLVFELIMAVVHNKLLNILVFGKQ